MRRLLLCALVAAACGDGNKPALRDDAGTPPPADAAPGSDGAPDPVVGCLDSPGADVPPTAQMPCDLVPPGVTL